MKTRPPRKKLKKYGPYTSKRTDMAAQGLDPERRVMLNQYRDWHAKLRGQYQRTSCIYERARIMTQMRKATAAARRITG